MVIATTRGWPEIRPFLEAVLDQTVSVGAEVIVADGSLGPRPPQRLARDVHWLRRPAAGVVELRALAFQRARGEIVAVTEDHCMIAPDWCERIVAAHERHPGAAAIKGAVSNGSPDRLVDCAAFFLTHAPHLAPFRGRPRDVDLPMACVSYRRQVLQRAREPWPVELRDYREWLGQGHDLVADETIRVAHHQSVGFRRTSGLQFHNARAVCGVRRGRMGWRDWVRLAGAPALPLYRTARTTALCLAKRAPRRRLLAAVPVMVWFYACKGAGEIAGYLAGPGDSPRNIL